MGERLGFERLPSILDTVIQAGGTFEDMEARARLTYEEAAARGTATTAHAFAEELFEVVSATSPAELRMELVQAAAVLVFAVESLDAAAALPVAESGAQP